MPKWDDVIKTLWPVILGLIGAIVFVLTSLNGKAEVSEVNGHTIKLTEHSVKIDTLKEQMEWLLDANYKMATHWKVENIAPPPKSTEPKN